MRLPLLALFCLLSLAFMPADTKTPLKKPGRLYEMRVYYAQPGKLDSLLARFRNHTTKLFARHGMTNEGYWLPMDNTENKLVYVLSYPNRAAREKSWQAFGNDADWKKAAADSEKDGKLIAKIDNFFLAETDFSPRKIARTGAASRVFELRTYKATPGNLPALLARFKGHTVKLFEKYGMTNLWYWTRTEKAQGADDMLAYILAHPSREAGLAAFKKFGADPEWQAAKKTSEAKAGSSLTVFVESEYMVATDFSPVK